MVEKYLCQLSKKDLKVPGPSKATVFYTQRIISCSFDLMPLSKIHVWATLLIEVANVPRMNEFEWLSKIALIFVNAKC